MAKVNGKVAKTIAVNFSETPTEHRFTVSKDELDILRQVADEEGWPLQSLVSLLLKRLAKNPGVRRMLIGRAEKPL
ncbi:hypothetical protein [Candidatus Magnetobacterium casense]|uniref:Uncharacterized protein n=1 Tax=Candidatus Magnetobacterium casense TaxID=1455061 RepID=A0ABS6S0G1_9BACT|nr:hypothetical protein [Candidatus Magnetobacterium casensis]MBV6342350.1 hypothetical protein [Candidatus Magnetobacterium casensis]